MGEIILVRHGQANSHAKTEAEYDRLSDRGHEQAKLLGAWFHDHGYRFDHILSGTMRRHRETVAGLGLVADEDARLNEIDYYQLTESLHAVKGEPYPTDENISDHMPKVFEAWAAAEIEGGESYKNFEERIGAILKEAAVPGRRLLAVTSGGVIGMVLRHVLDLDILRMSHVMLPIWNTSVHRLHIRGPRTMVAGYNAIPHLDRPELVDMRTHY